MKKRNNIKEWELHDNKFYSQTWFERWEEPLVKREVVIIRRVVLFEKENWNWGKAKYHAKKRHKHSKENLTQQQEYNNIFQRTCRGHCFEVPSTLCGLDETVSYYEDLDKALKNIVFNQENFKNEIKK